jgi:hypothetical protein
VRRFYAVTTRAMTFDQSCHSAAMPMIPHASLYGTHHRLRVTHMQRWCTSVRVSKGAVDTRPETEPCDAAIRVSQKLS